jgi:hypothetical protein
MRLMKVWIASLAGVATCLVAAYALSAPAPKRVESPPRPGPAAEGHEAEDTDREGPGERRAPGPPGQRPKPRPGDPDAREPGPPRGPDGPPRGDRPGDFDRRRPGPFGPGQQPGPPPLFGGPRGPNEDWASLEKNDPELYKLMTNENDLERRTRELAGQYHQASKDQRDKIKGELQKLVTQQFEARQQRRTMELKRFEDELKRLRDAVDRREKNRQQIIDKRVSELAGDESETGF